MKRMLLGHYKLIEHKQYIEKHGQDLSEVRNWRWGAAGATGRA
jgi:xylulose-5-phosphate/fructose-6-phosphate phosphoketolase